MLEKILLLPILVSAQPVTVNSTTNDPTQEVLTITTIGQGVARKRKAEMQLFCADKSWIFAWQADTRGRLVDVHIAFVDQGETTSLNEASEQLTAQVQDVHSVSASCNTNADGSFKSSNLLLFASYLVEPGPILAELESPLVSEKPMWVFMKR